MKKKNKTYSAIVKVTVETVISITAESFEEALIKARENIVKDVVEFDTDFNDGSIAVIGVYTDSESGG